MSTTLAERLLERELVDPLQLQALQKNSHGDEELAKRILEHKLVDKELLQELRAEDLGVTAVDIDAFSIDPHVVSVLPEELARRCRMVALFRIGNDLTVAMADPADIMAIDEARDATGCDIQPVLATRKDIEKAIGHYYGVDHILHDLIEEAERSEAGGDAGADIGLLRLEDMAADQSPIVRIVNLVILKAIRRGASDIHIEPDDREMRVRYRVDGRLLQAQVLPMGLHPAMVSRIKILADLDLAQKRLPQDGRITLHAEGRRIDLRLSTLPTVKGEKIVMRLLDTESNLQAIDELGLGEQVLADWKNLVEQPNGLVLVTGPTGSGKTTTLYASLAAINDLSRNIVTVEDPVEYDFPIINQVQVNVKAGLSFAAALRSILRQDPNVVMVGEIRDRETALIAIRAALTGHLVLSTLHTNDAPSAATRLIDMGVEPYLVASALRGILAQRLVGRLCDQCATDTPLDESGYPEEVVQRVRREGVPLSRGKGCRMCNGAGMKGRVAIHELLVVRDEVERAIVQELPASEIANIARQQGMQDLFGAGLDKVRAGLTTLDEVVLAAHTAQEEAPAAPATGMTPEAEAVAREVEDLATVED